MLSQLFEDHYRCSLFRELAYRYAALSLDELIDMSIWLDNLLAARWRSKGSCLFHLLTLPLPFLWS